MSPYLLSQLALAIDLGSMSSAAQRLNVTQPTLTRNIKAIEDKVGAPVLVRTSRGVVATDIGERLAERGRAVLAESEAADEVVRQWREGLSSELRIGVGPLLAASFMPELVKASVEQNWPYALRIYCASAAPLIDKLINNQLDVALAPSQLSLHEESLVQSLIFPDELVIVAGAKSELAQTGAVATKEKLEQSNWVIAGAKAGIHGTEAEIFKSLGIQPKIQKTSISGDMMIPRYLLRSTDVLMVLPKNLLTISGGFGAAKIVETDFAPIRRDIALWMRKSDQFRVDLLNFAHRVEDHLRHRVALLD